MEWVRSNPIQLDPAWWSPPPVWVKRHKQWIQWRVVSCFSSGRVSHVLNCGSLAEWELDFFYPTFIPVHLSVFQSHSSQPHPNRCRLFQESCGSRFKNINFKTPTSPLRYVHSMVFAWFRKCQCSHFYLWACEFKTITFRHFSLDPICSKQISHEKSLLWHQCFTSLPALIWALEAQALMAQALGPSLIGRMTVYFSKKYWKI